MLKDEKYDYKKLLDNYKNAVMDFYDKHKQDKMFLFIELMNGVPVTSFFDADMKKLCAKSVLINITDSRLSIPTDLYIFSCNDMQSNKAQIDYMESSERDKTQAIYERLKNPNNYLNISCQVMMKQNYE